MHLHLLLLLVTPRVAARGALLKNRVLTSLFTDFQRFIRELGLLHAKYVVLCVYSRANSIIHKITMGIAEGVAVLFFMKGFKDIGEPTGRCVRSLGALRLHSSLSLLIGGSAPS